MKVQATLIVATIVSGWMGLVTIPEARADHWRHIDEVAHRIEAKARLLRAEAHHFLGMPEYGHFIHDSNQFGRLAQHVRQLVHTSRNIRELQADVRELDRLIAHIGRLVNQIAARVCVDPSLPARLAHVRGLIRNIEACVHELESDVDALLRHPCVSVRQPVSSYFPARRHSQWYGRRFGHGGGVRVSPHGATIRIGSAQFHFGF